MSPAPLVSVVMPCFDQRDLITEALDSCLRQTHRPLEVIVVDDGSQDDGAEVARRWGDQPRDLRLQIIRQSNLGPAAARQAGLQASRGSYIQYLDADDLLEPDKIRPQAGYLERQADAGAVYGDWKDRAWEAGGSRAVDYRRSFPLDDFLLRLVAGEWVALHSFLVRRDVAVRYAWDTSLGALEDFDYWFHLALDGVRFDYLRTSDCAVYCNPSDRRRRNQVAAPWLAARLRLQNRIAGCLEAAGLLADGRFNEALAIAYLGLCWRALQANSSSTFDQALARALKLLPEKELCRIDWMIRLHPWLGVRLSLQWRLACRQVKQAAKSRIYPWANFDRRLTWRENLYRKAERLQ